MFHRHNLDTIPYPISPNDVYLYDNLLQININVVLFFDDEGRARDLLIISRKSTLLEKSLFSNHKHIPIIFRYYKTHLLKAFLSRMQRSNFIRKS